MVETVGAVVWTRQLSGLAMEATYLLLFTSDGFWRSPSPLAPAVRYAVSDLLFATSCASPLLAPYCLRALRPVAAAQVS
jgi:hypothetical protein